MTPTRDSMTAIEVFTPADTERYATVLQSAARAIVAGDPEQARLVLEPIAGEIWMGKISGPARKTAERAVPAESVELPVPAESAALPVPARRKREVPNSVRAAVFIRDGFRCTFCGGRAVPRNVLVALSDAFPAEIPYNANYARGKTHPVYWALAPEADHVLAHARGGADDLANLTTLHATCNTLKSDLLVEDMAALHPGTASGTFAWHGLLESYRAIVELGEHQGTRHSRQTYHRDWLRYFGV